jgi:hypothetical protein
MIGANTMIPASPPVRAVQCMNTDSITPRKPKVTRKKYTPRTLAAGRIRAIENSAATTPAAMKQIHTGYSSFEERSAEV